MSGDITGQKSTTITAGSNYRYRVAIYTDSTKAKMLCATEVSEQIPAIPTATDTKVLQTVTTDDYTNARPLLVGASGNATVGFTPTTTTDGSYATSRLQAVPANGRLYALQRAGQTAGFTVRNDTKNLSLCIGSDNVTAGIWDNENSKWLIEAGQNGYKFNGHTLNADVPSGAKFTDTTYTCSGLTEVNAGNQSFYKIIDNTTTDSGWGMFGFKLGSDGRTSGAELKAIRMQTNAPSYLESNYASGIAFGGGDTKGAISVAYSSPHIKITGGNGTKPVWWIGISATSGSNYTLNRDTAPTSGSTNLITSGAVYSAIVAQLNATYTATSTGYTVTVTT